MSKFCKSTGGNTGLGACDLKAPVVIGLIFTPKNAVIEAGTTDVSAFLQTKIKAPIKANRWFPFIDTSATPTNSSEEPVIGTMGSGYSEKLRNGNAIFQFDFVFGLCKSKILNQFDGWSGGVFLVSKDAQIIGRRLKSGDLAAFIPTSVYTSINPMGDGQNISVASITLNFGDRGLFADVLDASDRMEDFDPAELNGIVDVRLSVVAQTATTVDVKALTRCDETNLYDAYQTERAVKDLWGAIKKADGSAVVISTVVAQDATKSFRLTFTAGPSGEVEVGLVNVGALAAAGVVGYEGNTVTVTF
jgi:hypothetical protein